MNASNRADKLMLTPMKYVPAPAIAYAEYLGKKYGMCGEVYMTAFAHFAECYEGAEKSVDNLYVADNEARAFFSGYWAATETPIPKGWQLVPKEPTVNMLTALLTTYVDEGIPYGYEAMLTAAPKYEEQSK